MPRPIAARRDDEAPLPSALHVTQAFPPVMMRIEVACAYAGIRETLFRKLVEDGRLPEPIHIGSQRGKKGRVPLWYRPKLELALATLAQDDGDELVA